MSISLKDFVKQTLLDITTAVDEAKHQSPVWIAPGRFENKRQLDPQMIDFSVQVSVSEEKVKKGSGDASLPLVTVLKVNASGELSKSDERMTTQTLKFSVPVYFQSKRNIEGEQGSGGNG